MENTPETMTDLDETYMEWFDLLKKYGGMVTTPTGQFESLHISVPREVNSALKEDLITVSTSPAQQDLQKLDDPKNLKKWLEVFIQPQEELHPRIGKRPDTANDDYEIESLRVFLAKTRDAMEQSIWAGINKNSVTNPIDTVVSLQPFANIIEMGYPEVIQDMSPSTPDTKRRLDDMYQHISQENFKIIPVEY